MTVEEIKEGNKVIANFMRDKTPKVMEYDLLDMKYNSSWDWLMPVCNKLFHVQTGVKFYKAQQLRYRTSTIDFIHDSALEYIYNEVIYCIKVYNDEG